MKLQALDQINVSAVKADSLRPHEEFEVSDALGAELLAKHPAKFRLIAASPVEAEKAETAPKNKALKPPRNKAAPKRNVKDA